MERNVYQQDLEAICAHGGRGQYDGEPLVAPIVHSTTFCRDGVDSTATHTYSRVSNPTVAALETTLGELESAPPAVCFASGLAAETALFLAIVKAGDHIVCGQAVYGGTARLLQNTLSRLNIETTFVDATRPEVVRQAIRENTKLVFIETPANPTLELTDITAIAAVAHEAGALLAVDNTFMTAVLQLPLEFGADISVYSTTKFVDGHSVAIGGAIVTRNAALLDQLRLVRKSTGGILPPFSAWLTLQGLKTLPLRIRRQSQTAWEVARWLRSQSQVARVYYSSPDISPQAQLVERQHRGLHGAVVSFEIRGGLQAACDFVKRLRLCRLVEHVGSLETLITHPATMTHPDVPAEQKAKTGITDGLLRLSIGVESPESIIADIEQAFCDSRIQSTAVKCQGVKPCVDAL